MWRETLIPRADADQRLKAQGLSFYNRDEYWKEDACYRFTAAQIQDLEDATSALHSMCLHALDEVIGRNRLAQLGIPPLYWEAIAASRARGDFSLYGRFDFSYDGKGPPKLLEYNADTPTALLEAAVCQWFWLEDVKSGADQFNSLHEKLIARWKALDQDMVYLTQVADSEEDWVCNTYLMDTLEQAGRSHRRLAVSDIGWDAFRRQFVDLDENPIPALFKLYPWEWMMREQFGPQILESSTQFIEPLWKSVLSCKGLLPILWELYPDHPNLLPAYFEPGRLADYVQKPMFSREGANIEIHRHGRCELRTEGEYGGTPVIYQGLQILPCFEGHYPVIGSW
jgi:glutathionylspermidine synthase